MYLKLSRIGRYVMMTKRRGYAVSDAVARVDEHFATNTRSRHNIAQTMSVLLETSLGDITIDLLVDDAPRCCEK